MLGALLVVGPCIEQSLDGKRICSRFSLVTIVADSFIESFVASSNGIKHSIDESSLLFSDAWVVGALLFVGPSTGHPLDGERHCSRVSFVTVVADSFIESFVASSNGIKASNDESSLLLPDAWVLDALLFAGPSTEQPLDWERLCSCFSLLTVVADSLIEPLFASGNVIKDSLDDSSLLLPDACVLCAFLFVNPSTEQPLDGERHCSRVSLVMVVADSAFEPFVASAKVIKDSIDQSFLLSPDGWVPGTLLFVGPCTRQPMDGERLCSRVSLVTVVADSLFEPFVASKKVILVLIDENSAVSPGVWVLGPFVFVGSCTEQPLDWERLWFRFSLLTVVADSLVEPFVASGKVIKDSLHESSLVLPGAWVLFALLFIGPCIEQPLDANLVSSPFSSVKVFADSLFEPFVASKKVILDLIDENSVVSPRAWLLGPLLFVGPCTEQPLDGETLCSRFSLLTVIPDSLFESFAASGNVVKDSLDESFLLLPDAWVLGALLFVGPCTEQPLDVDRLSSPFSFVEVFADSLFESFVASGKVIRISLNGSSRLLP